MAVEACKAAFCGLHDAFRLQSAVHIFRKSPHIQALATQCCKLNGAIFLTSVLFLNYVLQPLLAHIILDKMLEDGLLGLLLTWLLRVFWIFPIYCISFILSGVWYQDIADEAFLLNKGADSKQAPSQNKFVKMLSEELYRMLVVGVFLLQCTACSFLPYIGSALSTVQMTWLCSLYSFEYKWSLEKWPLEEKLFFFESNWAYMAGFGLPAALVNWYFPQFVNYGIYALVFPLFIVMAIIAKPPNNTLATQDHRGYFRLPVFGPSKWLTAMILRVVCHYQRRNQAHGR